MHAGISAPYSPDLNPIEHFWAHLKRKIGASTQKTDNLFEAIEYILAKWNEYNIK